MQISIAGSRILPLAFASLLLLSGCGDTAPYWTRPPEGVRVCGKLDGVEPVAPVVVGEDDFGCPIFAPVPCTGSRDSYDPFCGEGCRPAFGSASDGDIWLIGCGALVDFAGCADVEFPPTPPVCVLDPFQSEPYWLYSGQGCPSSVFVSLQCWDACDPDDDRRPFGECGFL